MEYDIQKLQESMKHVLKPNRYLHSLGVSYTAANLAMRYGCDMKNAQVAGILHDCAKHYDEEQLLHFCEGQGIPISEAERKQPFLLHAKVGAVLAETEYGIEDSEITQAIRFHTTGKPDMSVLESIVFLADYIEPSRKMIPGLPEIRKQAYIHLEQAVYMTLSNTLKYLDSLGGVLDSATMDAYIYYKTKLNQ